MRTISNKSNLNISHQEIPSIKSAVILSISKFASISGLSLIIGIIASLINARLLGPELYGIWLTATILFPYFPFLAVGVDHAAYREIPLHKGRLQLDRVERIKQVYFTYAIVVTSSVSIIVIILSLILSLDPRLAWSLRIVAIMGFFLSVSRWGVILLKSENLFGKAGLSESMLSFGRLLSALFIYLFKFPGIWIGNLIGNITSAIIAWRLSKQKVCLLWDWKLLQQLIKIGLPITLVSLFQILSITGDKMLILGFLGTTSVGIYGLGRSFTQILFVSGGVVGPVIYPRLSERYGRTNDVSTLKNLVIFPTILLGSILPEILGYAWFGLPVFVRFLLPDFISGILPAQLLFYSAAIWIVSGTSGYLFMVLSRQVLYMIIFAVGVGLTIVLECLALMIGWELSGVAAGALAGNLICASIVILYALKLLRIPLNIQIKYLIRGIFPILMSLFLCIFLDHIWVIDAHSFWNEIKLAFIKGSIVALVVFPFVLDAIKKTFGFSLTRQKRSPS